MGINIRDPSTIEDSSSIFAEDKSFTTAVRREKMSHGIRPTGMKPRTPDEPPALLPVSDEEEEEINESSRYETPTPNAKTAIRLVLNLNERDGIGVGGFMEKVRAARARCMEEDILFTLILNEKIQEDAERDIRYVSIRDYTDLYDELRKFVSIPTTSSCARDKLGQIRQGTNESVHSYIKRFRQ
jgi:hypothetical protein